MPRGISYWHLAWKNKLILTAFLLLGALVGTGYVILKTPIYRATTTVELVGFNQSFMGMSQVDPQAGTDSVTASASNIQTQTRILTSRSLIGRAVERMNLEMTPVTSTPTTFFTKLRSRLPSPQTEPLAQGRDAVALAGRSISARGVGMTRLIEIQCESTSPEVAANFVNTVAQEHISQTLAARANLTQRTSQWMESQLEESKSRLQQAGEKLREFVQKSGMDFFPEQTTLADSKFKQLQENVSAIQADRIAKQSRWELARSTPPENLPDVLSDATLQTLKTRIAELRREKAQLTATLMPEHYKVQRIQAQITEMEQTLEKEKAGTLKRLQGDYEEASRREKLLLGAYGAQTRAVSAQADKASQYAMLKRDVELQQQLYNSLLQQSNQAALIALAPSSSIRVVDPATPVSIPSSPNPVRDIPGAAIAGGGLGFGLLFLRETFRRKKLATIFDTPGHTRTLLGVPELGVIPSAQIEAPKKSLGVWTPARIFHHETYGNGLRTPEQTGQPTVPEIVRWQSDKSSLLSESFRQTLVSILGTKANDHNPLYVITSAGPGEGKTTLCANLAAAMANIGHQVLLVDADLRRAHLHRLFGSDNQIGLSDILASSAPIEASTVLQYIQPTSVANLQVMTHGREVESPAPLFFSPRTEKLLSLLRRRFSCIFVDTAPALAYPDARLLGRHADGVVLVVRAGVTSREGASAACQRFLDDRIRVLGTILNDWTPANGPREAYYYGYGYEGRGTK
jgi:capsular exopolysaccharide synthesis family protein